MMPTKLLSKEEYLTPDEFVELLRNHFEQMPTDKLFKPMVMYISCDKENRETVAFDKKAGKIIENMQITKTHKKYHDQFCMKTIIRDKTKAN